jgi:hypothetical protein
MEIDTVDQAKISAKKRGGKREKRPSTRGGPFYFNVRSDVELR